MIVKVVRGACKVLPRRHHSLVLGKVPPFFMAVLICFLLHLFLCFACEILMYLATNTLLILFRLIAVDDLLSFSFLLPSTRLTLRNLKHVVPPSHWSAEALA